MHRRALLGWALVVVAVAGLVGGCSQSSAAFWKVTKDSSGSCEVSTPSDWQLGRDFFLERESANAGPIPGESGLYPPMGAELWGVEASNPAKASPAPTGQLYQLRTSVVHGDWVCSVWRIKESTDFTAADQATMAQVGKTLQAVP